MVGRNVLNGRALGDERLGARRLLESGLRRL
jgi:hypothetical protein